jgi:hypothetical protein
MIECGCARCCEALKRILSDNDYMLRSRRASSLTICVASQRPKFSIACLRWNGRVLVYRSAKRNWIGSRAALESCAAGVGGGATFEVGRRLGDNAFAGGSCGLDKLSVVMRSLETGGTSGSLPGFGEGCSWCVSLIVPCAARPCGAVAGLTSLDLGVIAFSG